MLKNTSLQQVRTYVLASLFLHVHVRCVHHRVPIFHYFPFAQELCKVIDEASMLNRQLDTVRAENIKISKVRTVT